MSTQSSGLDGARPRVVLWHGSPGAASDFDALARALGDGVEVLRVQRRGYPSVTGAVTEPSALERPAFHVGYSWGCVPMLEAAAEAPKRVLGLVLVAPFFRASKPMGAAKRALLGTPGLGKMLVARLGPKAMAEFAERTARPAPPPASYAEAVRALPPEALLRAMLEKEEARPALAEVVARLSSARVPSLALVAGEDAVGTRAETVGEIEGRLLGLEIATIPGAGHALPFTHPSEVAQAISTFIRDHAERVP